MHEAAAATEGPLEDAGLVAEVIRPAAILPAGAARGVLVEIAGRSVARGGLWHCEPTLWSRYDRPWNTATDPGPARLVGTLQVAHGTPSRFETTVYRVSVTVHGTELGWSVSSLCDETLGFGGTDLASCPRAALVAARRVPGGAGTTGA
ncbi:hypothetical protein [Motilibacter deserti]|uniref:Polyketide cyclase/dehydrase/lipid transport protein n=1 Tax=Motilibacter deserti TaxID=2714956 RepID=A0ABX0GQ07_9ACTN|nr:hypothetical protein [Motilibacter deserti]NHC12548.1 hypothetical protein [Motilibacter deserti]